MPRASPSGRRPNDRSAAPIAEAGLRAGAGLACLSAGRRGLSAHRGTVAVRPSSAPAKGGDASARVGGFGRRRGRRRIALGRLTVSVCKEGGGATLTNRFIHRVRSDVRPVWPTNNAIDNVGPSKINVVSKGLEQRPIDSAADEKTGEFDPPGRAVDKLHDEALVRQRAYGSDPPRGLGTGSQDHSSGGIGFGGIR